jgi:hypothetical protein
LWNNPGRRVPIRYVMVRDPAGELEPQPFLCTDLEADPLDILRWFGKALVQGGQAFADHGRPTSLARQAPRWRFMKRGVEPQACDHGDPRSHIVEQVDRSEAGIADANDAAVRQPARRLDQDLPAPVSKLLILSVSLACALPNNAARGPRQSGKAMPSTVLPSGSRAAA